MLLAADDVDVYLMGGQSNMQGIGKFSELEDAQQAPIERAYFWQASRRDQAAYFERLEIGKTKTSSRAGEFGPEIGLARKLASAQRPIYIIKFHVSGMPLHHGWHANKWLGGEPVPKRVNFSPGKHGDDDNRGKLYVGMLSRVGQGLANLRAAVHTPVVPGFVWMQGAQDIKNVKSAKGYAASLKQLRDRLMQDLELDKLPMVFGQVLPHEPAMDRFTHREESPAAMAAADGNSGKPEAIENCRMVSTDGMSLLKDSVHYDAAGQLKLGAAFADALTELAEAKGK